MKKKTVRLVGEIVLVALIVGSIFLMGKFRVHQLHLDIFFPIGFVIILVLLISYAVLFRLTEESPESTDNCPEVEEGKEGQR